MTERYTTNDNTISKFVHNDGAETSIKTWPKGMESCGGSGRDKFNVFASCSVGCPINCGFCFLTSKKYPYHELTAWQIATNTVDAIEKELQLRPELADLPFNLSWMGMGDPWLYLDKIAETTNMIMMRIAPQVKSIEGVDIATTLPNIKYDDIKWLRKLHTILNETGKLEPRPIDRTPVRVFYSLHSLFENTRNKIIPRSLNVDLALNYLEDIRSEYNVIYHYMFLDDINDNQWEVDMLTNFFARRHRQLRILRFNECPNTKYKESKLFNYNMQLLSRYIHSNDLKVQLSPGSEVSAACGMFLMKDII